MGKRKKNNLTTLTKIDPSLLMPKPHAVSHHASGSGIRAATVTTTVNPVQQPPPAATLLEPALFNVDPLDFAEGLGDDGIDEDVSREYHIARVSDFYPRLVSTETHSSARIIHSCYGLRLNATCTLTGLSGSRAEGSSLMDNANCAIRMAFTVVLTVLLSTSFVRTA